MFESTKLGVFAMEENKSSERERETEAKTLRNLSSYEFPHIFEDINSFPSRELPLLSHHLLSKPCRLCSV